jgi:hypothetical protein
LGVLTCIVKMKHSNAIGFTAAVLFTALWALPLARAVAFFRWAQDYFGETGSLNASNDLHFSIWLLGCYLISLVAALAFAWLLSRRPRLWLLFPAALLAFAAGEVLWLRPEEPIHLFPTMNPWRPVFYSMIAVGVAALLVFLSRTDRHERRA